MDSNCPTTSQSKVGKSKSVVPGRKHKATLSHVEIYNGIPDTSVIKVLPIRTAHSLLLRFFIRPHCPVRNIQFNVL